VAALPLPFALGVGAPVQARAASLEEAERDTFARLYTALAPRVHRFLSDLLFDATLARDGTQETFARVLLHPHLSRDEARIVPFVFGVARNVSLELRRARARAGSTNGNEPETVAPPSTCPEATLAGHETARALRDGLAALPEERRAILLLRLDHGLSYDDVATTMGVSLAKVKIEIFRAKEALRAHLEASR